MAAGSAGIRSVMLKSLPDPLREEMKRSDGSSWTLTLKDVFDRAADLEMAYNVNDCVELRWGASARSDEASTCKRYAPGAQRAKMTKYRAWFHERRRPPRA